MADFGLTGVHVRRFRSLKDTSFRPGAISAIVGEPSTGKSNLLTAIWALLDPESAPLSAADVARDDEGPIQIVGELADGSSISVGGELPDGSSAEGSPRPPAVFFPAGLRDGALVAPSGPQAPLPQSVRHCGPTPPAERLPCTGWWRDSNRGGRPGSSASSC